MSDELEAKEEAPEAEAEEEAPEAEPEAGEAELDAKEAWYAALSPEAAKAQAEVDAEVALSALYNK